MNIMHFFQMEYNGISSEMMSERSDDGKDKKIVTKKNKNDKDFFFFFD